MLQTVTKMCSRCSTKFEGLAVVRAQTTCPACVDILGAIELDAWKAEELRWLPDRVNDRLRACGFRDAELTATLDGVPASIKRALPKRDVQTLMHAQTLTNVETFASFGIAGGQGIGKTMCLAAMIRFRVDAQLRVQLILLKTTPDPSGAHWYDVAAFRWINWPETSAWMKSSVMMDKGTQQIEQLVQQMSVTPLLVLDDVGRERLAKAYDEDYANGMLDRVVDVRSRERRATLWTSNLAPEHLAKRYGAALTSRLLGMAPAIVLSAMPDQRLQ